MKKTLIALAIVGIVIIGCRVPSKPASKSRTLTVERTPAPQLPPLPNGLTLKPHQSSPPTRIVTVQTPTYGPNDFALTGANVQPGNTVVLTWQNGSPPFQPQSKPDVLSPWVDFGPTTMQQSITNPAPYGFTKAFFRVKSSPVSPGLFQWSRTGLVSFASFPKTIRSDHSGNSVAVGGFIGTIDFGNGPVTSAGGNDSYIAKLNSFGGVVWTRRIGNGLDDFLAGMALDGSDNVTVVGNFAGTVDFGGVSLTSTVSPLGPTIQDAYVAKYAASGSLVWVRQIGGIYGENARAVGSDELGNVVVSVLFSSPTLVFGTNTITNPGGNQLALLKFSASGAPLWSRSFPGMTVDALGIALDHFGDALITGNFSGLVNFGGGPVLSLGGNDIYLVKYLDADGSYRWAHRMGNIGSADFGTAVATDPVNAHILVTGQCESGSDFGNNHIVQNRGIFLAAYDALGASLWVQGANISPGLDDAGSSVTVDETGNVYYTGKCNSPIFFGDQILSGNPGCFIAAMTGTGTYRWAKRSGGASALGNGIGADRLGHVFVGGSVENATMYFDGTLGAAGGSASPPASGARTPWIAEFLK